MRFPEPQLPTLEQLEKEGLPPEKKASPEDIAKAKEERKDKKPRHYIKQKTEAWTRSRLIGLLNAVQVKKNSDELIQGRNGVYRKSTGVDYSCFVYFLIQGRPYGFPLQVEVKGVNSGSFPIKNLSKKEIKYLNEGREIGLSMISLVWCRDGVVDVGYLIPWRDRGQEKRGEKIGVPDWADILDYLDQQAEEDARFQGRSIREKDLSFLEPLAIRKVSGKWTLPVWLAVRIPPSSEMLPGF